MKRLDLEHTTNRDGGTRTHYLWFKRPLLSQLSFVPNYTYDNFSSLFGELLICDTYDSNFSSLMGKVKMLSYSVVGIFICRKKHFCLLTGKLIGHCFPILDYILLGICNPVESIIFAKNSFHCILFQYNSFSLFGKVTEYDSLHQF